MSRNTPEPLTSDECCAWQENEDGQLDTDCGNQFYLTDGTPPENKMKFCPYCGKSLAYVSYVNAEVDDDE